MEEVELWVSGKENWKQGIEELTVEGTGLWVFESGRGENCGNQGIQTRLWLPENSKKQSSGLYFLRLWCVRRVHGMCVTGMWLRQED